ncbi:MAG: hypothetical protein U0359_11980 [Byssovorax sp.]
MVRSIRSLPLRLLAASLPALLAGCDGCEHPPAPIPVASAGERALAPAKRYLKGQLHAHSNASGDSNTDPTEVTAFYERHGFDFLVMTDHHAITVTPSRPGLLVLPGVEITQNLRTCEPPPDPGDHCLLHINGLFVEPRPGRLSFGPLDRPTRTEIYGRAIDRAISYGGIAQLNHPNFQGGASLDVVLSLAKRGLTLMEIENQSDDAENDGGGKRPSTEQLWDAALTAGARVWGTATDDAHHYGDAEAVRAAGGVPDVGDRGWVMVRADRTAESIRRALVRGDFYASTGLSFDRLDLGAESIAVEVHDDGTGGAIRIALIGAGAVLEEVRGAKLSVDPRRFTAPYLRIRATDAAGRKALSQPLFR